MGSLGYWTIVVVLFQTSFSTIIGWLVLSCQLSPSESELHEVTLIKLLYLYDPETCGRVYFYNYTRTRPFLASNIVWPVKNEVSANFRSKIRVWLALHIIWMLLGVVYMSQGTRPCGFYVALLPFTFTGAAMLILDLVYTVMFLMEAKITSTEAKILDYINIGLESVRAVNKTHCHSAETVFHAPPSELDADTSWIALLLAYISSRAVVQWFINFWIVKDNYLEGLAFYLIQRARLDRAIVWGVQGERGVVLPGPAIHFDGDTRGGSGALF